MFVKPLYRCIGWCVLWLCSLGGLYGQSSSVLSEGTWYKLSVSARGIYAINAAWLQSAGFSPTAIDPRRVQLYGWYESGMLPQANANEVPTDLVEQPTYMIGGEDGRWDEQDMMIFYGRGKDQYEYDSQKGIYRYEGNIFTDEIYYFLRIDGVASRPISEVSNLTTPPSAVLTDYDVWHVHEEEKVNLLNSGRQWFGTYFSNASPTHTYSVPFAVPAGGNVRILSNTMGSSAQGSCQFTLYVEDTPIGTHTHSPISLIPYSQIGYNDTQVFAFTANGLDAGGWKLRYEFSGAKSATGYHDYFFAQAVVPLRYPEGVFFFRNQKARSGKPMRYEVTLANSATDLWVLTPTEPKRQGHVRQNQNISFVAATDTITEYVLFNRATLPQPKGLGAVPNQNLHGQEVPHLLIVTAEPFLADAQRLAAFRREYDQMEVVVAKLQDVYHEFSAAVPDFTAIRNYARYLYRLRPDKFKYLLLIGDATYDYKNTDAKKSNYVPTYQSRESLLPTATYCSDDYYGFLEEHEGVWGERPLEEHTLDIGIGRLPVRTPAQAEVVVNKIIRYATASPLGAWRTRLYFVADDGDHNLHHEDTQTLVNYLDTAYAAYASIPFYLDDYPQDYTSLGQHSPVAEAALHERIHQGAFVINFSGHGNPSEWTAESILNSEGIATWKNIDRLPLFVTATCEFGRYDIAERASAGEALLYHPDGGGIALLTTARPVYADANFVIDSAFTRALFPLTKEKKRPRLGDIMRRTKNGALFGVGNRSFTLLGDPSLQLLYPKHQLRITHLNGTPVDTFTDTLRALDKVHITGVAENIHGEFLADYQAEALLSVYDKPVWLKTLGDQNEAFVYPSRSSLLFRGKVSVQDGRFSAQYIMPRSISYRKGRFVMRLYAQSASRAEADAQGARANLYLSGTNPHPPVDKTPPQINAYLNTASFQNGNQIDPLPTLYIELSDENGIKLTDTGLGRAIGFILDNEKKVALSEYYVAELDTYVRGHIVYQLPNALHVGRHEIQIEAWDTYDNKATYHMEFEVTAYTKVKLSEVSLYPNPIRTAAHLYCAFRHDKYDHTLRVTLTLYTAFGESVGSRSWRVSGTHGYVSGLSWNFCQEINPCVREGAYLYRLEVQDEQIPNAYGHTSGQLIIRE